MPEQPTVLVADYHSIDLEPVTELLATHANVVFAASAQQLTAIATDMKSLDLIVLGCSSPDDMALTICRELKTTAGCSQVPVVMYANSVDADHWQRAMHAGAADVVAVGMSVDSVDVRIRTLLSLKYKTDLLTELALLDALTSVANRERFEQYLDIEWRRSLREFNTLTLLTIAIDGFHQYLSDAGLNAADNALRRLARLLENNCLRAADMVGRFSEEEFVALLPGTDLDNALLVADKMVRAFRALAIEHSNADRGVLTLSIGVASIDPGRDNESEDLLQESAEMLGQARHGGGDQVQGIAI